MPSANIGTFLARRLEECGIRHVFAVPGDFNLILLDQILKSDKLEIVNCTNELNASYAADGYARKMGSACIIITHMVGGLAALSGIAGAFSDHLPIICVSGSPNTQDFSNERIIHHSLGLPSQNHQMSCMQVVTGHQESLRSPENAAPKINCAFDTAFSLRRPAYVEVCCNIAAEEHPTLRSTPPVTSSTKFAENPNALEEATEKAVEALNKSVKPVLIAGSRLRPGESIDAFRQLADAMGCPVAVMPDAKGMYEESDDKFIGTYWGSVSTQFVSETIESADCVLMAGPINSDYTTVGFSTLLSSKSTIMIGLDTTSILDQSHFSGCPMEKLVRKISKSVNEHSSALRTFKKRASGPQYEPKGNDSKDKERITNVEMRNRFQDAIDAAQYPLTIIADTGDSWFITQSLHLPKKCKYEIQMLYGSIGWSVGSTMGYQMACDVDSEEGRRAISFIGDGAFQATCQEVGTMLRYKVCPIICLLNNKGYIIEEEIHSGQYNAIKNYAYKELAESLSNGDNNLLSFRVHTNGELAHALSECLQEKSKLGFIEICLASDDCTPSLLQWGAHVASFNSRKRLAS